MNHRQSTSISEKHEPENYGRGSRPSSRLAIPLQTKRPAQRPGAARLGCDGTILEAGHHALETQEVGERFKFAPLVVAEAHDQWEAGRLESIHIDLAHVDRS